jgi:hypothetical protein
MRIKVTMPGNAVTGAGTIVTDEDGNEIKNVLSATVSTIKAGSVPTITLELALAGGEFEGNLDLGHETLAALAAKRGFVLVAADEFEDMMLLLG